MVFEVYFDESKRRQNNIESYSTCMSVSFIFEPENLSQRNNAAQCNGSRHKLNA